MGEKLTYNASLDPGLLSLPLGRFVSSKKTTIPRLSMAMDTIPTGAAPRIAVVTTDESVQLAAQEVLASVFHTTLLGSGEQILPLLDEVSLEALILDLETAYASDQETLRLVRRLRERDEHLVLLGFTRSHNKASRNQFEQAGISHCFVAPVDFEDVQSILHRAQSPRARRSSD